MAARGRTYRGYGYIVTERKSDLSITYLLELYLTNSRCITIGKLGRFLFKKSHYIYVGSATKNIMKRIERHLKKEKSKFWHIDYLLQYATIKRVWIGPVPEEKIARILTKKLKVAVPSFGSSDKQSISHLFLSTGDEDFSHLSFDLLTDLKNRL